MHINSASVKRILGIIYLVTGAAMLAPLCLAALEGDSALVKAFGIPGLLSIWAGFALARRNMEADLKLSLRDGMLVVTFGWISASIMGALPYLLGGVSANPVSAFFESVSSYTTTGATVLSGASALSLPLLLWRSSAQWLGGLGTLAIINCLTPFAYSDGLSSVRTGTTVIHGENMGIRKGSGSALLYRVYFLLTALEIILLKAGGLSWQDSLLFSLSTVSSGGLNSYGGRLMEFTGPYIETVLTLFMVLSGVNFMLCKPLLKRDMQKIKNSTELKAYLGIACASALLVSANLYFSGTYGMGEALRFGGFQTASFMSTTGFAATDISSWPSFSKALLSLLGFMGGSSNSVSGALNVIRVAVLVKVIARSFTTRIHPNAVVSIKVNKDAMPSATINGAVYYVLTYFMVFAAGAFLLSFESPDFQSAFTASGAMLSNTGAAFGVMGNLAEYGAYGHFSHLVMCFLMLAGRLELYALLLIFGRSFWKEGL